MVGPSKILTVSYGTFSCTLEGFDDPFSTMRSISEYFRDLAAEDRYFGAEPPTPDAEMLHRIAEREVQRRVEAQIDANGVKLRQLEPEEESAPAPEANPVAPALDAVRAAAAAEVVEEPKVEPTAEPAPARAESVAEKLARIRAAVSEKTAEQDEDTPEDVFAATPISSAFDDVEEAEETPVMAEAPVEAMDAVDPEDQADAVTEDLTTEDMVDVVAEPDVETAQADPIVEEIAEDITPVPETLEQEETFEETETVEAASETDDAETDEEPDSAEEVDLDAFMLTEDDQIDQPVDVVSDEVAQAIAAAEEEKAESAISRLMQAVGQGERQTTDEDTDVTEDVLADEPRELAAEAEDPSSDMVEIEVEDEDEHDPAAIARVVKMRRADFEAAVAEGEIEEVEEEPVFEATAEEIEPVSESTIRALSDALEDDEEDEPESTLSPEDEAELMSNLEQVQRLAEAERRAEKEGRVMLETDDIEANTGSVSRILEVTNTEMEETEGTRRRSAIAHLKAAVAATRADKFLSKKKEEAEKDEMDQYRSDLARVVRPKRPTDKPKTERRMAPLMLVSEQRVDTEAADAAAQKPAGDVRPRRVTSVAKAFEEEEAAESAEENVFRDASSFAEFAEDMGASDLPDLLEAAAAYYSFVEGRPHFSRPQIMKAVAALDDEKVYSREEGLRSFGMLLRRGKIQKIKRGQFKVSDSTRFNPETRAAGE